MLSSRPRRFSAIWMAAALIFGGACRSSPRALMREPRILGAERQNLAGRNMELDRFDRQLLQLVQEDAGLTAEQLAQHVGLSPSAIQRRLRKLREQGVILRDTVVVDPGHLGSPTLFVVSLQVERERPELLSQLREWLSAQDLVQQVYYVTGEADFILIVCAPNTQTYDAFMSRMLREHTNIKHFKTNVVLNPVKRGLTIPVPLEAEG